MRPVFCAVSALLLLSAALTAVPADLLIERATYDAGAPVRCSATVADLDGDGTPEIIFPTQHGEVVAMSPAAVPKWIAAGMAKMTVPVAVADLLPEPGLEVVAGDYQGRVWCLSAAGRVLWQLRIGEQITWSSPAILDAGPSTSSGPPQGAGGPSRAESRGGGPGARPAPGSRPPFDKLRTAPAGGWAVPSGVEGPQAGPPLIVVGDETGGLCAVSAQGKLAWRYRLHDGVSTACPPAAGDVDGDGAAEVVFGASDGLVRCLSRKGAEKWSFKTGGDAFTGPVIADLNGDRRIAVVTASGDGFVYALEGATGKLVWKFGSGAPVDSSVAVADILPEPGPEVVFVNTQGGFFCLSAAGRKLWSAKLESRAFTPPCVADLDSDGSLELTIGDHAAKLYVFSATGKLLEEHRLAGRINASPTVVSRPQGIELVVPDEGGLVHVFLAPASAPGAAVAWSGFRGDPAGRGDVRAFAVERRFPIRIIEAHPGEMLMGPAVFHAVIRNDTGAQVTVRLQVTDPDGRTFVMERRESASEAAFDLDYEVLAGGKYRFAVTVESAGAKAAPVRYERTAQVAPFARDAAELAHLLTEANQASAQLAAAGGRTGYLAAAVDAIQREVAQLDLGRFETLGQAERRETAARFVSLLDRARRLAAKARFAVAARQRGETGLAAWPAQPYATFDADAVPGALGAPLAVTLCQGEKEPAALNIFNLQDEPLPVRVLVGDLKAEGRDAAVPAAQALALRRVVFAPSTDGKLYPDALPRLDAINSLTVAPWQAAQLWITVDGARLQPGACQAQITLDPITPGIESLTVPLNITVRSFSLEGASPLASCQWAYLDASATADKMPEAADDLLAHHTTVFPFVGDNTAPPRADAQGNLLAPLDFTAHDALFDLYHRPKGWLLYLTGSPQLSSAVVPYSPAWEKVCAAWLKGIAEHAQSLGLDYRDWAWYPIDEAGKEQIPDLLRAAQFAKRVDPRIQVYYDFFQGPLEVRLEDLKRLDPYIDIWQPHRGIVEEKILEDVARMDFLRSTGEPVWMYDTAGTSHSLSPSGYYRSQGWLAWQKRITGVGFWTYNSTATDQWQAGNEQEYLAIYQGREIVPSKRWEAWRDGIEDYWYLTILHGAAERARAAGRDDLAREAEGVIAAAVAAVLADEADPEDDENQRRMVGDSIERILQSLQSGG